MLVTLELTGPTGFPHLHSADLRVSQYPRGPGHVAACVA
jgi:hypothetical protein